MLVAKHSAKDERPSASSYGTGSSGPLVPLVGWMIACGLACAAVYWASFGVGLPLAYLISQFQRKSRKNNWCLSKIPGWEAGSSFVGSPVYAERGAAYAGLDVFNRYGAAPYVTEEFRSIL